MFFVNEFYWFYGKCSFWLMVCVVGEFGNFGWVIIFVYVQWGGSWCFVIFKLVFSVVRMGVICGVFLGCFCSLVLGLEFELGVWW